MKGVSAVIATVMMLVITIALAGMAYMFISGSFSQQTGRLVELAPSPLTSCSGNVVTVYIKNIGTDSFNASTVQILRQGNTPKACNDTGTVIPGGVAFKCSNTLTSTEGIGAGANTIVAMGSSGGPSNVASGPVYC